MDQIRFNASQDLISNISKLNKIIEYFQVYIGNTQFFYNNNTIYEDVYSVDIKSFNVQFLIYINRFINSDTIYKYINELSTLSKTKRVIEFGLFYREISNADIVLNKYMLAVRNIIFLPFLKKYKITSSKCYQLFRFNYDDIEFSTIESNITTELFISKPFLDISKLNYYDKVIVLNRKNGVYYMKDSKIIDIKYTSGWVNIPVYRFLIQTVISFILNNDMTMDQLNHMISEYIEYAPNDHFFGYDDDEISKNFQPNQIVPMSVKYLFVANVMSKFSILFKN